MSRRCKECGHRVEFQHREKRGYCPICDEEIEIKDTTVLCMCENMTQCGTDMHNPVYKSTSYNGFALTESYGVWRLEYQNNEHQDIEIFFCPLCGKKLNKWEWADKRREENLKSRKG